MKKIWIICMTLVLLISLASCTKKGDTQQPADSGAAQQNGDQESDAKFPAGTYTGSAKGFGGDITATVVLSDNRIESITAVGDKETEGLGSVAVTDIPAEIVEKQSLNVDTISGATVSSEAVLEAIRAAFQSAGVDLSTLSAEAEETEVTKETKDMNVDVVVVGAGGAGMTAAIELKAAGLDVVIVEKMPMVGGNTIKATGGMNAAGTHIQEAEGVTDSVDAFVQDTMEGGYNVNNKELVTVMAENSADAIMWLETIGAPLPKLSFSGGASNKRIHAPEDGSGVGAYLVDVFKRNLEEAQIPVMLNTKATEIMSEDDRAAGIRAEGKDAIYNITAKAVILATGGFGANEEMYTKYKPELKGYVTTNTPGATGDGILMAQEMLANLVDIEQIQIHPTVEQTTSIMITESVRGGGAILVNQAGKRFCNELLTRDVVSAAVIEQQDSYAYLIFDQRLRDNLAAIEKYVENNITVQADTIEGLAEQINVDKDVLSDTLKTWNEAVKNQDDKEFERGTGMENDISAGPFYAIKIAPGVHHTMGGVEINEKAEVLGTDGNKIYGLYAAGEVTGGIHGANRIGGNAVADIVVFGRIAAASAIEYCK